MRDRITVFVVRGLAVFGFRLKRIWDVFGLIEIIFMAPSIEGAYTLLFLFTIS